MVGLNYSLFITNVFCKCHIYKILYRSIILVQTITVVDHGSVEMSAATKELQSQRLCSYLLI